MTITKNGIKNLNMNNNHYSKNFKVWSSYCDSVNRLSPYMMQLLFEELADANAMMLAIDLPTLAKRDNAFWVVRRIKFQFLDVVRDHDDVILKTWPSAPEVLKCFRSYQILKNNNEPAVNAVAEWVILDKDTRRLRKTDSIQYPDIQFITEKAVDPTFKKFKDDFTEDDFVYEKTVRACDIDLSHHTNNTRYCMMVLDSFSVKELESMTIKELEIHYEAESLEGDVLRIYRKKVDDEWLFAIKRDGKVVTYAVIGI